MKTDGGVFNRLPFLGPCISHLQSICPPGSVTGFHISGGQPKNLEVGLGGGLPSIVGSAPYLSPIHKPLPVRDRFHANRSDACSRDSAELTTRLMMTAYNSVITGLTLSGGWQSMMVKSGHQKAPSIVNTNNMA